MQFYLRNTLINALRSAIRARERRPVQMALGVLAAVLWILAPAAVRAQSADLPFAPNVNGPVYTVAEQPDGKIIIGGAFTQVNGENRAYIARLLPNGVVDATFAPEITTGISHVVNSVAVQADGKIIVGGYFARVNGVNRLNLARLHADGSLDVDFTASANTIVVAVVVQQNQQILLGGYFQTVNGQARALLARLHADGALDNAFNPTIVGNYLTKIVVDDAGRILLGGLFSSVNGQARTNLARLDSTGALDSAFPATVNAVVYAITVQPDGKVIVGGAFSAVNGTARFRLVRLNADGTIDGTFTPQPNNVVRTISLYANGDLLLGGNFTQIGSAARSRLALLDRAGTVVAAQTLAANDAVLVSTVRGDGNILIGGNFTQVDDAVRNRLALISPQGALDRPFTLGANDAVYALAHQADGRSVAGGAFSTFGGQARAAIARLTVSATLDAAFAPVVAGAVNSLLTGPMNDLVIGGGFTQINGEARANLAKVDENGVLDAAFTPDPNAAVHSLLRQPDGKLLVAGAFTQIAGGNRQRLARLNADGTLDAGFTPDASGTVRALARQQNGAVLAGGAFTTIAGRAANRLARLTASGAFDASFVASATGGDVYALLVQPDGKILVGGAFTQINGQARPYLARLAADGSLDASFAPATTLNGPVYALALQADGRLIVAGAFTQVTVNGAPIVRNNIARFEASGAFDAVWNPNANNAVHAIVLLPDGKVLIGGAFTQVAGQAHAAIARLSSDAAATQTLTVASDGDSILWSQAGASPELTAVHFFLSTDGLSYAPLGAGVRLEAGWAVTGTALPMAQNLWVRAYGEYPSGQSNGSISAHAATRIAFVQAADVVMATTVAGGVAQPSAWRYTVNGKQVVGGGTLRVDRGSFTVAYAGPAEYTVTGASGACSLLNGVITLNAALGANTCALTFTRDTGTINFVKTVEGGAAQASAFSFTVQTRTVSHGQAMVLETGVYTVVESGPAGYVTRTASGACALVDGALRLTVTKAGGLCTVVNTWPVTLAKQVSGGQAEASAWSFSVAGQSVTPGSAIVLAAGTYTVTESGPPDYTLYAASGDCALVNGAVRLTVPATTGSTGLCTITNRRDTGTITFVKQVEGGPAQPAAFNFTATSIGVVSNGAHLAAHGESIALETGIYSVAESGPADYVARVASGACTLVDGEIQLEVTTAGGVCTVTNTQLVTFIKQVEGGTSTADEWRFTIAGQEVAPGAQLLLAPGVYTVTESGPPRYTLVGAADDCTLDAGVAQLTVPANGNSVGRCTLINRRDTGVITFNATVEAPGVAPGEFIFTVIGQNATGDGAQMTLPTEDYTVSIGGVTGFAPRLASGVCTLVDGALRLAVDTAGGACNVTMTRPVRFVSVVQGGARSPAAWSLRVGEELVFHDRPILLVPGVYTPTLQGVISTYTMVEARDACSLTSDGQIVLDAPGNGLCTIVNRRNTGFVTFTRVVQGGDAQPAEWVTLVNSQRMPLDAPVELDTNNYVVTESGPPDYVVTAAYGICSLDRGQIKLSVTTAGGECGLVSTRGIGPVGFVMRPNGGNATADQWSFVINGQAIPHNGALLMPVGLYTVTVQGPEGYSVIGASGICSLTEARDVQLNVALAGGTCNLQSAYDAAGAGAIGFFAAPIDDAPPQAWAFEVNSQVAEHNHMLLLPVGAYPVKVNGPIGYHTTGAGGACTFVDGEVKLTVTVLGGACTVQTAPNTYVYKFFMPHVAR